MTVRIDSSVRSWVPGTDGSDFPIQNLPYGVARRHNGDSRRIVVAIGDHVLDLTSLAEDGLLGDVPMPEGTLATGRLNELMGLGRTTWGPLRQRIADLLQAGSDEIAGSADRYLHPVSAVEMLLPMDIGDYVDFYSSIHHASNVGAMFRPDDPPLLPNWRWIPIGYHGRASSIVVSGSPIVRPSGQRPGPDGPTFGPSRKLDIELEVGFVTGPGTALGSTIPIGVAEDRIFGMCLVNDWSARDLQAWEYRPLGPFLGKSFATTVSPWIVTLDALEPFRIDAPTQDPEPLPYLEQPARAAVDLRLAVELNGSPISRVRFADMYWSMAQQLAHAASNGTNIRPGDLYASGTVSGADRESLGCLLELTWNGTQPVTLPDGSTRSFLEDGDTVVLTGRCEAEGEVPIGFGECAGAVLPAVET